MIYREVTFPLSKAGWDAFGRACLFGRARVGSHHAFPPREEWGRRGKTVTVLVSFGSDSFLRSFVAEMGDELKVCRPIAPAL